MRNRQPDGLVLTPMTQTSRGNDQDVRVSVCQQLLDVRGIDNLGVAVNRGVVTLSGEVGSLPERLAAKRAVMRVRGVTAVADDLQVRAPGTPVAHRDGHAGRVDGQPRATSSS